MLVILQIDQAAFGINFMLAVSAIPLRDRRVFVHVLDDLPPADAGVICAEGDFALLRGIRNDAHLRAAEIVVEQILEPHAGDEQEIPGILFAALLGIFEGAIGAGIAVFLYVIRRQTPGLMSRAGLWATV